MSRRKADPAERALDAVMALSPDEAAVFDRIIALKDRIAGLKDVPRDVTVRLPRRPRKAKPDDALRQDDSRGPA